MKAKAIRRMVMEKSNQGMSKQKIYDELNSRIKGRELDLAAIVVSVPTLERRQHWKHHTTLLMILLAVSLLLKLLYVFGLYESMGWAVMAILLAICAGQIWGVATYRRTYYLAVGAVGGVLFYQLLEEMGKHGVNPWIIVDMAFITAYAALAIFLGEKYRGRYRAKTQQYQDAKGQIRTRATVTIEY